MRMSNPATKAKERGSALEKSILVLEAITEQPQAIGLPDITSRVDLPRQTVHRILLQLEVLGLVIRDSTRDRFAVGPRLSYLAHSTLRSANHGVPIRQILAPLVEELNETCNVGVLDGMEFVYLERIECDWPLRIHLQAGSRVPAHCTAGGKLLLAHLPPDLRKNYLKTAQLNRFTDNTIVHKDSLEAELDQILVQGYSVNREEYAVGIMAIGVPIFDKNGTAMSALALHAPIARLSIEDGVKSIDRLKEAAEELGRIWL